MPASVKRRCMWKMGYLARERLSSHFICNIVVVAVRRRILQTKKTSEKRKFTSPCVSVCVCAMRYRDTILSMHTFLYLSLLFICSTALPLCVVRRRSHFVLWLRRKTSSFGMVWQRKRQRRRDGNNNDNCLTWETDACYSTGQHIMCTKAYTNTLHYTVHVGRWPYMCICRNSFAKYLTVFLLYQSPKPSNCGKTAKREIALATAAAAAAGSVCQRPNGRKAERNGQRRWPPNLFAKRARQTTSRFCTSLFFHVCACVFSIQMLFAWLSSAGAVATAAHNTHLY